jgi:inosose dehydratase
LDFISMVRGQIAGRYDAWVAVEAEQDPAVAPGELYARKGSRR